MVKQINIAKALIRYNGKYLLLKKANDTYFPENIGKWECSGGVLKENETPEETILRETKQETGLEDKIVKELPSLRMTDENYDSQCKVYLLEAPKKDIILDPKKHSKYKWVAPENIKNMNLVLYANLLLEFFNNPEIYLN